MNKIAIVLLLTISGFGSLYSDDPALTYESHIKALVKKSCIQCHKAPYRKNGKLKKPKAGLRLDSYELMMKGGDDGPVIKTGKPEKSSFYTLTILPVDHDDIMPSKGDLLTKKEQDLIKRWILEGAKEGISKK